MTRSKIEIIETKSGLNRRWYWRVKAANGEILCHSEQYNSKQACKKCIRALRLAALVGKVVEGRDAE